MQISKKQLLALVFLLLLVLAIPVTLYLVKQTQVFKPKAVTTSGPIRGVAGDLWADVIIGKPDFSEINPGTTVDNKLWIPHGVIVDRSVSPNRMYIYDSGNNRILGFSNLDNCISSTTNPLNCHPDLVLGQPNFSTSACNGDSGFQNYPNRAPATASTLCSLQESQNSISEGGSGSVMYVDSAGNLYVTDFWNHRVLKYNSPFTTDRVADDVWGQADFSGQYCNRDQGDPNHSTPSADTLCFTWGDANNETAGVALDPQGNLWVVDNGNNRVLRFPAGSKTADIVLGQSNFSTRSAGDGLNQLHNPSGVRVDSQGRVYVSDRTNNRVLRFNPTLRNGMTGEIFVSASEFAGPTGLEMTNDGLWVNDSYRAVVKLFNVDTGVKIRQVGAGNDNQLGGDEGSIGVDSAGDVLATTNQGDHHGDTLLFMANAPTVDRDLFGVGGNLTTNKGLLGPSGVAVYNNQLIVTDRGRIMFWNNANSLTNGQEASGIVPGDEAHQLLGCCSALKVDSVGHLYVVTEHITDFTPHIAILNLPLTPDSKPIKTLNFPFQLLGGGTIDRDNGDQRFMGLAPSSDGKFLWLSFRDQHRVFRVRDPLTNPVVDVILGQTDANGKKCNFTEPGGFDYFGQSPKSNSLCYPGALSLDRAGNLYIADDSLEINGNMRLLEYNAGTFPANNQSVIFATTPSKTFSRLTTLEAAFDSRNQMVVGLNPYGPNPNPVGGWFPAFFSNPLSSNTPDNYLRDYYSEAVATTFDSLDNLYVADLNRGRVLIYKGPLGSNISPPSTEIPSETSLPSQTTPPINSCTASSGDANGDGVVNGLDFAIWSNEFLSGQVQSADFNCDGVVNGLDFAIWSDAFLKS